MATTVGGFSAIDDTEVDAESPITETLITRLRDNSYWIDAGTRQTTQTSTTKVLTPNGSGGVAWVEVGGIAGVDGTKGSVAISNASGSPTQVAIVTSSIFSGKWVTYSFYIDSGDDTYVGFDDQANSALSGTLSGSYATIYTNASGTSIFCKKVSTNYEFYSCFSTTLSFVYAWLL